MPYQVGTAHVEVRPSFRTWNRDVRAQATSPVMEKSGESAGAKVAQGFERGASRIKMVIGSVVGVATAAAASAATVGLRTAAGMETANIAFTTMLGSGKKAQKFLKDLSNFAAKTPFEFPELQTASQSLISIGIDANKVIPIMTTLGNVTAGMGTGSEGIKRATVAIQQMNAAQRVSAEDLNQLRDAGIPVYELLAKAMGKSTKEVANLAGKGKLGKDALDAMMKALESGKGLERFNGMMEKQSTSMSGLWSTLKDTFSVGMAQAIQPVVPLIKDGLGKAIEQVTAAMPKLAAGLTKVVKFVDVFKQSFRGAVRDTSGLSDGASLLAIRFGYLARTAGPFLRTIRDVMQGGAKDTRGMNDDVALLAISIGAKLRKAVEVFDQIKTKVSDMKEAFKFGPEWQSKSPLEAMAVGARTLVDAVKNFDFSPIVDAFSKLSSDGGGAKLQAMFTDLSTTLPAAKPSIDLFGKAISFAADHVDLLAKALPYLIAAFAAYKAAQAANNIVGRDSLLGFSLQIGSTISLAAANRALAKSQQQVTASTAQSTTAQNVGLVTRIRNTAATIASTVAQKAAAVATRMAAAGQWLLNAAMTANPIGLVIVGLIALGAMFVLLWKKSDTFRTIVTAAWNGIKTAASATVSWVRETAWPWMRNAFQWIGDKAKWLWEKGIKGPFDRIKAGVGAVRDAFGAAKDAIGKKWDGLVDAVAGPIRSALSWVSRWFISPINTLLSKVGIGFRLPTFNEAPRPGATNTGKSTKGGQLKYADGGVLPGYSPGRDDMHWYSPILGKLSLAGGEAIMRPEWTRALGKSTIDAWNAAARSGGVAGVRKAMGFASGGIIDKAGDAISGTVSFLKDPVGTMRRMLDKLGGGVFAQLAKGALSKVVGKLGQMFTSGIDGASGPLPPGTAKGVMGWQSQWAWLQQHFPGAVLTSSFRPGAITASGNRSYHSMGRAIDVAPSTAVFNLIRSAFGSSIRELIYSPMGGAQIKNGRPYLYGEPVRSMHYNHVHWAMRDGGLVPASKPLLFDAGGTLPPTRRNEFIPVQNFTGGPERLLRADQLPVGGDTYNLYGVDYNAAGDVASDLSFARRAARREGAYAGRG